MKISYVKPYKTMDFYKEQQQKQEKATKLDDNPASSTLKGVLLNKTKDFSSTYKPTSGLIIMEPNQDSKPITQQTPVKSFDTKKALTPLIIGTAGMFGAAAGLSLILKRSANTILNTKPFEQLPDLALNMNIKQEPEFATYMMLRNPNAKTVMGAMGVFAMSALTVISKNFVDGVKEVWIKKQESDIQRDLQENLIDTETQVFSGKLQIERNILGKTAQYFDKILNNKDKSSDLSQNKVPSAFKSIHSFKGAFEKQQKPETSKQNKNKKQGLIFGGIIAATAICGVLFGKLTFKNLKKTAEIANTYTNKYTENIIDTINKVVETKKEVNIDSLSKLFESICATPEYVTDSMNKLGASENDIKKVIQNVANTKKSVFADAPIALGGITKKIQYYCYLDENRGHLYNWIMNPDNKFLKYVFLAFTGISAAGYAGQQFVDSLKAVAVTKENSNTELELRKKLIDVELKNFEAKKNSAVTPLIDEFNKRVNEGKSEEELKELADNILLEIKNSAPFVYS